jgi:hypothetical protein
VRYGLSVAAGVDLHMAARLAITRASVMCVILSLSARKASCRLGRERLSELGNAGAISHGVRVSGCRTVALLRRRLFMGSRSDF